jgi:hypothetical protein
MGRSRDRQRAVFMTASGHLYGRHWAVFRGRRHTINSRRDSYDACSYLCDLVIRELAKAQRLCEATGITEHWRAAVTLNDALSDY